MFWNKKDSGSSLPDLPPLKPELVNPPISKSPLIKEEDSPDDFSVKKYKIPSFPDSPSITEHSQANIKEAVEEADISEESSLKYLSPIPKEVLKFQELREHSAGSNIFIKIEKFNSARKALASAQQKISEIDTMLKKIRETRMREEQELTAWEREVENAKTRIEEASESLFDKLS